MPIGRPIKYQPIIITIHTRDNRSMVGITFFIVPSILIFESLSYLYIKPIAIIRYIYIGDNALPTESAAINTVCVKAGDILALINSGI